MMIRYKPALPILTALVLSTCLASARLASSQTITLVSLPATVEKTVDAKKSKAGDPFTAKITTSAKLSDGTDVPADSILQGQIGSITPSENKSDSTLVVTINKLQLKNGKTIDVKATITSVQTLAPPRLGGSDQDGGASRAGAGMGTTSVAATNKGNQSSGAPDMIPQSIPGLTLTSSPKDSTSGTLTQSKKNIHLPSGALLQVAVAVLPPGVISQ